MHNPGNWLAIPTPYSTAFALLNIRAEGARLPDVGLPQEGDYAALLSGHFAVEAPAPPPKWAEGSSLREDMLGDLRHALEWTADALGLPRPDGGQQRRS